MLARALLVLAALLLGVPGLFVSAKGLAAVRRRSVYVQGRTVGGPRAIAAGAVLIVYGLGMIAIAVMLVLAQARR